MDLSKVKKNQEEPKPKLRSLLIESVANGFIVYENGMRDPMRDPGTELVRKRQVFNTKDQLNKFINDNLE